MLLLIVFFLFYFAKKELNKPCDSLKSSAQNEITLKNISILIRSIRDSDDIYDEFGIHAGVNFVKKLNNKPEINFDVFDTPIDQLTIEVLGDWKSYEEIDSEDIQAVAIGYGYRYKLVSEIAADNVDREYGSIYYDCMKK